MLNSLNINKISYCVNSFETPEDQASTIEKYMSLKLKTSVQSSYNSIVVVNLHNNTNSYEFNYLAHIDSNGNGYPLYKLIHRDNLIQKSNISTDLQINIEKINETQLSNIAINEQLAQIRNENNEMFNNLVNVVKIFTDESVQTILGLQHNIDAATSVNNIISQINNSQQYNINNGSVLAPIEIIKQVQEATSGEAEVIQNDGEDNTQTSDTSNDDSNEISILLDNNEITDEIDFGNININSKKSYTITVKSSKDFDGKIRILDNNVFKFKIGTDGTSLYIPLTLNEENVSSEIIIVANPTSVGENTIELNVTNNDESETYKTITLKCTCTQTNNSSVIAGGVEGGNEDGGGSHSGQIQP